MDILKKLQAIRKLLGILYEDHVTNDAVRDRIRQAIGPCNDILTTVKKWKLKWFSGQVSRSALLGTTILQGTVQEVRRRGRQKKGWEDNTSSLIGQVKVFPRPKII